LKDLINSGKKNQPIATYSFLHIVFLFKFAKLFPFVKFSSVIIFLEIVL